MVPFKIVKKDPSFTICTYDISSYKRFIARLYLHELNKKISTRVVVNFIGIKFRFEDALLLGPLVSDLSSL